MQQQAARSKGQRNDEVGAPAPELSLRAQITIGVVVTSLFLWGLPWLIEWMKTRLPAPVHALAQEETNAERARRYAAVIAACLNGQSITDGTRITDCNPR
jgi:hypothetical protein